MVINFKYNLIFSKIIAVLGMISMLFIILELLKIFPSQIMNYLIGFSFVTAPLLLGLVLINCLLLLIICLIKSKHTKNYSNIKKVIGFSFIGVIPFTFYILMITIFGF